MSLLAATETAIAAAQHLEVDGRDAGALEALRVLARKIDRWDVIVEWAEKDAEEQGGRPAVPQNDNVSISAYAKLSDALGLTPIGRKNIEAARYGRRPAEDGDPDASTDDAQPAAPARVDSIAARRARSGRPA